MGDKPDTKEKNKTLIIVIAAVAIAVVAVIAVIVLMASGVFGEKEIRLYNGLNELKPGSYLCVNNSDDYIDGYIINDEPDDYDEFDFRGDKTTSLVLKSGQKLEISDSDDVDIVCTKQ